MSVDLVAARPLSDPTFVPNRDDCATSTTNTRPRAVLLDGRSSVALAPLKSVGFHRCVAGTVSSASPIQPQRRTPPHG